MKIRVKKATDDNWYKVGEEYDVCENTLHRDGHEYHPLVSNRNRGVAPGDFEVVEEGPKSELTFPFKVKCIDNDTWEWCLNINEIYTVVGDNRGKDYFLEGFSNSFKKSRFEIVVEEPVQQPKTIDSHYNFDYAITETDREKGVLKVDPYFVAKQWRLGGKDDTGVLFHCLKNISRYSDKNTKEREITALYLQVKRLAELENVKLD
jgi:hypothetical protein